MKDWIGVEFVKSSVFIAAAICVILIPCLAFGEIVQKPEWNGYVYDYANVINNPDELLINAYASSTFELGAGTVIVLTVQNLDGMDAAQYATDVINKWGIGSADANDGLLILLAPSERRVQIGTGSGIDTQITGEVCGNLIDNYAIDLLSKNQFSAGIRNLAKAVCLKMCLLRNPLFDDMNMVTSVYQL